MSLYNYQDLKHGILKIGGFGSGKDWRALSNRVPTLKVTTWTKAHGDTVWKQKFEK